MHRRTIELLEYLDNQRAELRAAFLAVPAGLRNEQPAGDAWSANGVIEHVALVEARIARQLQSAVDQARADGTPPELHDTPVLPTLPIDGLFDRRTRLDAAEAVWPTGQDADESWAALEAAGEQVRDALRAGDGMALGTRVLPHRRFGEMSLYYFFAFVGAHEGRHALQIREIATRLAERT